MRQHQIEIRVRYAECDPMGIAHHSAYAPWYEMGRTELLRSDGVTYREIEAGKVFLAVVELNIKYKKPARYDDVLTLTTKLTKGSMVKVTHEYELRREYDLLATGYTTLACLDINGQARQLPEILKRHAQGTITPQFLAEYKQISTNNINT